MADLEEGEIRQVRGSSGSVYELRNVGGVYSCSCPAWRNQSHPHFQRTCKHLIAFRGAEVEKARLEKAGAPAAGARSPASASNRQQAPGTATASAVVPPLLLAHSWDQVTDLSGWWMSEKLDGVRAYWDGRRLISRLGNAFAAPDWFLEGLPDHPLDGELWGGRKRFQRTVSIVRRQDGGREWNEIQFVVFDAPGLEKPFEERQNHLVCLGQSLERIRVLQQQRCGDLEHLRSELSRVESEGGEGLMLRQPGSLYEIGRSWTLLKVKSFQDAEAVVVGHQPGEGRHRGRLGALVLELPNGIRFSVGTGFSDAERSDPPPLGALVTFRYQELSDAGVPRFPSWVGVRFDAEQPAAPRPARAKPKPPEPVRVSELQSGPTPTPPAESPPATNWRRFEFVGSGSEKFWEISLDGNQHTVRFGRLGSAGQSKTKTFADPDQARLDAAKLVAEKLAKGYQEVP